MLLKRQEPEFSAALLRHVFYLLQLTLIQVWYRQFKG